MKSLNKILNYLVIAAVLILLGKGIYERQLSTSGSLQDSSEPKYDFSLTLKDSQIYFPEADSIALHDVNIYDIFEKGKKIGRAVNTSPFSDEIYGYNSTTPLTIYLDERNKIFEVEICENRESRGYLNRVINEGYLDLWDGLSPEEAANHNVDAVSGCTFTSVAIEQSMQVRMQELSRQESAFSLDWKLLIRQVCILIVTILATICFFKNKSKVLRIVTLFLSIFVLGFWNNSLLSLALFYNWITNGVSLAIQLPLLIIAVLSLLLPLFTKKSFYCQYLCPFGAAQEFAGMIPVKKINISAKAFKFFSILRKIILLTLLIIMALGVGLDLSVIEPFPIFNYQSIGFGVAVFAGVILAASIFMKKPWCNFICPTGTFLESFRKLDTPKSK